MPAHVKVRFVPGINPSADETNQNTVHCIDGDNVRFRRSGVNEWGAESVGGFTKQTLTFRDLEANDLSLTIDGCPRKHFSYINANKKWQIIGTHTKLYAKFGTDIYNITPLVTSATATLGADPLDTAASDATLSISYTAHGLAVGDRIKLSGATDVGGITAATHINKEHIVATVVDANTFTVEMGATAGSTASGGGSSIDIFKEIAAGECTAVNVEGYGIGTYGTGLFGASQTDVSLFVQPRIWWMDTFGDILIVGPGQGGAIYEWLGDTDTAPVAVTNAPAADWGWVEDAKIVILRDNIIANCDTGDRTNWTASPSTSAYEDAKEDARKLIGRAYANGENLIFGDDDKLFRLRFVGGTVKWLWERLDFSVGIMGPEAYVNYGGIIYIFGKDDLYAYNTGVLTPIQGNTLWKYVYEDINIEQRYKFFAWYNEGWDEVNFHYTSASATENDRAVFMSRASGWFSKSENLARTCGDRGTVLTYPVLAAPTGEVYEHESGVDADGAALKSFVKTSFKAIAEGAYLTEIQGVSPDVQVVGNLTLKLHGKDRPLESSTILNTQTITAATGKLDMLHETRWRAWELESNEVGGSFRWSGLREFIQQGAEF